MHLSLLITAQLAAPPVCNSGAFICFWENHSGLAAALGALGSFLAAAAALYVASSQRRDALDDIYDTALRNREAVWDTVEASLEVLVEVCEVARASLKQDDPRAYSLYGGAQGPLNTHLIERVESARLILEDKFKDRIAIADEKIRVVDIIRLCRRLDRLLNEVIALNEPRRPVALRYARIERSLRRCRRHNNQELPDYTRRPTVVRTLMGRFSRH